MKITRRQLKQLIKEEINLTIKESKTPENNRLLMYFATTMVQEMLDQNEKTKKLAEKHASKLKVKLDEVRGDEVIYIFDLGNNRLKAAFKKELSQFSDWWRSSHARHPQWMAEHLPGATAGTLKDLDGNLIIVGINSPPANPGKTKAIEAIMKELKISKSAAKELYDGAPSLERALVERGRLGTGGEALAIGVVVDLSANKHHRGDYYANPED
jgi:hypothetical protein